MTVAESLRSLNSYPVPSLTLQDIAESRGLVLTDEVTTEMRGGKSLRLAKADVYKWLSTAPNISQSGITYTFTDAEKRMFRDQADDIYTDLNELNPSGSGRYGYKGESL